MIKEEYLRHRKENGYSDNTIIAIQTSFNLARKYEEIYDKDLCQFSVDEIKKMFADNADKTLSTLRSYICFYRDYTEYCIRYQSTRFQITSNTFLHIEPTFLDSLRNTKTLTEKDFIELVNACEDKTDLFIVLGIYRGMTMLELILAEYKHIHANYIDCYDFVDGKVVYSRKIYIDYTLKEAARIASETYKKVGIRADGEKDTRMYYGKYIIKDGRERNFDDIGEYILVRRNSLYNKIALMQQKYKIDKLYNSIRKFAIAQTVIESMSIRGAYTLKDIGDAELGVVNAKFNMNMSIKKLKQIMKDYLEK